MTDQQVEGPTELRLELQTGLQPTCWDPVSNSLCEALCKTE